MNNVFIAVCLIVTAFLWGMIVARNDFKQAEGACSGKVVNYEDGSVACITTMKASEL